MPALGLDVGATKTAGLLEGPNGHLKYAEWPSGTCHSAEATLERAHLAFGKFTRVAIAAAGRCTADGTVKFTNLQWPDLSPSKLANAYDRLVVLNDVACAAEAMPTLGSNEWLQLNNVTPPTNELIAVAVSTGNNSSHRDRNGLVRPAESGHVSWQPWDTISYNLLSLLQQQTNRSLITVEDVISGNRGFTNLSSFALDQRLELSLSHLTEAVKLHKAGQDIGPAITAAAMHKEEYGVFCMDLWVAILGQYLRSLVMHNMPSGGTIYLYGGVAQAPGVMDYVRQQTNFWKHFYAYGTAMSEVMKQTALRFVIKQPGQHPITVRGALKLAKKAA